MNGEVAAEDGRCSRQEPSARLCDAKSELTVEGQERTEEVKQGRPLSKELKLSVELSLCCKMHFRCLRPA